MLSQTEETANILEGQKPLNFTPISLPAILHEFIDQSLVDRLASKQEPLREGFYRMANTCKPGLRIYLPCLMQKFCKHLYEYLGFSRQALQRAVFWLLTQCNSEGTDAPKHIYLQGKIVRQGKTIR
jgi:hypothetical protein